MFSPSCHPGRVLAAKFLAPQNLSVQAFAERCKWTEEFVHRLIAGHVRLTSGHAQTLAQVLGASPDSWMALQHLHDATTDDT